MDRYREAVDINKMTKFNVSDTTVAAVNTCDHFEMADQMYHAYW